MVATQRRGLGGCDPVLWHDRIVQQAGGPEVNVCEKGDSRHRARTLAGGQSKTQHLRPACTVPQAHVGAEDTRSQPAPAGQAGEKCLCEAWRRLGEEALHCDHTCPRNEVDGIAHPSA